MDEQAHSSEEISYSEEEYENHEAIVDEQALSSEEISYSEDEYDNYYSEGYSSYSEMTGVEDSQFDEYEDENIIGPSYAKGSGKESWDHIDEFKDLNEYFSTFKQLKDGTISQRNFKKGLKKLDLSRSQRKIFEDKFKEETVWTKTLNEEQFIAMFEKVIGKKNKKSKKKFTNKSSSKQKRMNEKKARKHKRK